MGCVSADDTNFLTAREKFGRHYMSGITACSKYYVHKVTSLFWFGCGRLRFRLGIGNRFGSSILKELKRAEPLVTLNPFVVGFIV